jgi:hypothetical protein
MIINVSDHIRRGEIVEVVKWHKETLIELGLKLVDGILFKTPRMSFGQNAKNRVSHEIIMVFKK